MPWLKEATHFHAIRRMPHHTGILTIDTQIGNNFDATEVELQPWGSAGYVEDSYTLTFGGVDYEIPTATLTGYRAVADSVPSPAVVPAPSASPAPLGRVLLLRPSDPPA